MLPDEEITQQRAGETLVRRGSMAVSRRRRQPRAVGFLCSYSPAVVGVGRVHAGSWELGASLIPWCRDAMSRGRVSLRPGQSRDQAPCLTPIGTAMSWRVTLTRTAQPLPLGPCSSRNKSQQSRGWGRRRELFKAQSLKSCRTVLWKEPQAVLAEAAVYCSC